MGEYSMLARVRQAERDDAEQVEPAPLCGHVDEELTRTLALEGIKLSPCIRVSGLCGTLHKHLATAAE